MKNHLSIYYSNQDLQKHKPSAKSMMFQELVGIAKSPKFVAQIGKYRSVSFFCPNFTAFPRPFLTACICRLMTCGSCSWINAEGDQKKIGLSFLFRQFWVFVKEKLTWKRVLSEAQQEISALMKEPPKPHSIKSGEPPLYLRCDIGYGYIAGGSIGHIAGVLNNFGSVTGRVPLFLTTDKIPTVSKEIPVQTICEPLTYGNVRDISGIVYNIQLGNFLEKEAGARNFSFVYQRSALNIYAGARFAMRHNFPFVLEYNGSEVWTAQNWSGRKLNGEEISLEIERLTFQKADLIVCVSKPLREELIARGVDGAKILVNPNGVDPHMYRPDLDGRAVRERYNIPKEKIVVGFIGTFGAWHGADVLARAFAECVQMEKWRDRLHLLMVGDGITMPKVKEILAVPELQGTYTLTGMVSQKQGPEHLAACDILCSPTVPNPDGSPFFGSPTKLFEYMAMGKAIIVSDMDQMGEIMEHERTALLCEPANEAQLSAAICRLAQDPDLRNRLGTAARDEVCSKYTWKIHTERIYQALTEILS